MPRPQSSEGKVSTFLKLCMCVCIRAATAAYLHIFQQTAETALVAAVAQAPAAACVSQNSSSCSNSSHAATQYHKGSLKAQQSGTSIERQMSVFIRKPMRSVHGMTAHHCLFKKHDVIKPLIGHARRRMQAWTCVKITIFWELPIFLISPSMPL